MLARGIERLSSRIAATLGLAALLALGSATAAPAAPIASTPPNPSLPAFQGSPATAKKLKHVTKAPQNPFMAENPNGNVHNDTWMTDQYLGRGPLGNDPQTASAAGPVSICTSLDLDSHGRLATVCPSAGAPPQARIYDPATLATIATYDLPQAPNPPYTPAYQNFTGGGYYFLDDRDRIWVPTKTDHIFVLAESADGTSLSLARDYDLTSALDTSTERITSALPDFAGRIWFVSKKNGKVGTVDRKTGEIHVLRLDEEIENSFAVGENGVYIVSDRRMYRFEASKNGKPKIVWKAGYENSGIVKPGQVDAGSGTTPTIMKGGYVAITDNANRMDVVVYRTARKLHGKRRKVCQVPVFEEGKSATENSLITAGRSLLVENNYGYQDPLGPNAGAVTEPGFARVDVKKNGNGCKKVWTNHEVRAPTVVPKIADGTGLIYAYSRPADPSGAQGYYWTAIRFKNGATAWSQLAGSGPAFNNNYSGMSLDDQKGVAYISVAGGILRLSDG
jgi:hypothetical protein